MSYYNYGMETPDEGPSLWALNHISENSSVLEFGPANGRLTKALAKIKHCSVDIVEWNLLDGKSAARYARTALVGKRFGNINNMWWRKRFCGRKYDAILFLDVLEHLEDPATVLSQVKAMLKKNGTILVSIPNLAHNGVLIDLMNDRFEYHNTGLLDKTHIHFFAEKSIEQMAHNAGFKIIGKEAIEFPPSTLDLKTEYSQVDNDTQRILQERQCGNVVDFLYRFSEQGVEAKLRATALSSSLYYTNTGAFSEQQCKHSPLYHLENQHFETEFSLSGVPEDAILRLDPLHGQYMTISFDSVFMEKVEMCSINASRLANGEYTFFHDMPSFEFRLKEKKPEKIVVSGIMKILDRDALARMLQSDE